MVLHPVWAVVSALVVNPPAWVVLVGRFTAVMVTGYGFGVGDGDHHVARAARDTGGCSAAGEATAVMLRLAMVADCPSPDEPALRPTTQLVAA